MERYLDLILLRFGLIAVGLVVPALVIFAVALALKRRGRLNEMRGAADPVVRAAGRALLRRLEGGSGRERRRDGRW
ncbi:hypothetical protein ACFY12_27750 [Streptomyces sp. NPDC001339]|uniref:hypothetical protein n=1 Tax=Streptomyces sp. NPDC001339 TaxID=3364563 RepID=UPI00369EEF8B